jgi:3-oxoacyl-[acyl-carrier-protein] synthase-3
MMLQPVGIRSIAVSFPSIIRTNDYYRENYPELVARVEQKTLSRVFSPADSTPKNEFELEMMPYLSTPFAAVSSDGCLLPVRLALTISYSAAKDALTRQSFPQTKSI